MEKYNNHVAIPLYKNYFITGGMPEAVKQYISTGSFFNIPKVHEDIYYLYLQSLSKYSKGYVLSTAVYKKQLVNDLIFLPFYVNLD